MLMGFDLIPAELRETHQWCLWRSIDGRKVPCSPKGYAIDPTDPKNFLRFESAHVALATDTVGIFSGLGFCLTRNDPFACIDLDQTDDPEKLQIQTDIYNQFVTYSELSPSSKGIHLWLHGAIGKGINRKPIEIYSQDHFMTITGNAVRAVEIKQYQTELEELADMIATKRSTASDHIEDEEERHLDADICNKAYRAVNGEKFLALYKGDFRPFYPSQSEADFALVNIICFYSRNKEQVERIFRASGLFRPEKTHHIQGMIARSFDNYLPPIEIGAIEDFKSAPVRTTVEIENHIHALSKTKPQSDIEWPPGFLGEVARFVYDQSPRPSPEISIGITLAFFAGVLGRSYNVEGLGLNLFTLVLADTGRGKEAASTGLSKLMAKIVKTVPKAMDFIGPSQIASEQGLLKHMCNGKPSIVCQIGEIGMHLQSAMHTGSTVGKGLKKFLTILYTKSGQDNGLNTTAYSNKENNTPFLNAPAFSIFGESVPSRFYEALDEFMVADGFVPRMIILEHPSDRSTPFNENHAKVKPTDEMILHLQEICSQSLSINERNIAIDVPFDAETSMMQAKFRDWCDHQAVKSRDTYTNDLWTRTHVKALKIAALLAVARNHESPIITAVEFDWACKLALKDSKNIIGRFEHGDTGSAVSETKQHDAMADVIKEWFKYPRESDDERCLCANSLIPISWLYHRLYRREVFKGDRIGSSAAIKRALKTLEETGRISTVSASSVFEKYATRQLVYKVTDASLKR
jgi:hypothetical protein